MLRTKLPRLHASLPLAEQVRVIRSLGESCCEHRSGRWSSTPIALGGGGSCGRCGSSCCFEASHFMRHSPFWHRDRCWTWS
eukprot:6404286-Amphidinium_carterae.1